MRLVPLHLHGHQRQRAGLTLTSRGAIGSDVCLSSLYRPFTDGLYNTEGTRAHTHRELVREWLWGPTGSSLEYIWVFGGGSRRCDPSGRLKRRPAAFTTPKLTQRSTPRRRCRPKKHADHIGSRGPNLQPGTVGVYVSYGSRNGFNTTEQPFLSGSRARPDLVFNVRAVVRAVNDVNNHRPRFQIRARPS